MMLLSPGRGASAQALQEAEAELIELLDGARSHSVLVQLVLPPEQRPGGDSKSNWLSYSGTLLDGRGTIATAMKVVKASRWMFVLTSDGEVYRARSLGIDPDVQLGFLAVDGFPRDQTPRLGDAGKLVAGSFVAAIGSPYGLQGTARTGIVSAPLRNLEDSFGERPKGKLIQIQIPINSSDVGGTLINSRGEVVGVLAYDYHPSLGVLALDSVRKDLNALAGVVHLLDEELGSRQGKGSIAKWKGSGSYDAKLTAVERDSLWTWFRERMRELREQEAWRLDRSEKYDLASQGIHFAVPIDRVLQAVDRVRENPDEALVAESDWGNWMGITVESDGVSADLSAHLKLEPGRGLIIKGVVRNGPAARAGFEPFDILWSLGGRPMVGMETFREVFGSGYLSEVEASVIREGEEVQLRLLFETNAGWGSKKVRNKGEDRTKKKRKN